MQRLVRVLGALVLAVAGAAFVPAPAMAAYCSNNGVHVLVDFGSLGGGLQTGCARTTSRITGDQAFAVAGFSLSFVSKFPGAVCRVEGKPESEKCAEMPPRNAYWALFVARSGGKWAYSQASVGSTRLVPGDSVAFAWQSTSSTRAPGTGAGPAQTTPKPSPSVTTPKTKTGSVAPVKKSAPRPRGAMSAAPTASATTAAQKEAQGKAPKKAQEKTPKKQASPSPRSATTSSAVGEAAAAPEGPIDASPREPGNDGVPGWVPAGVVVGLSGAAAGAFALRRKRF